MTIFDSFSATPTYLTHFPQNLRCVWVVQCNTCIAHIHRTYMYCTHTSHIYVLHCTYTSHIYVAHIYIALHLYCTYTSHLHISHIHMAHIYTHILHIYIFATLYTCITQNCTYISHIYIYIHIYCTYISSPPYTHINRPPNIRESEYVFDSFVKCIMPFLHIFTHIEYTWYTLYQGVWGA